jgi:RNA-binding protein YlmH
MDKNIIITRTAQEPEDRLLLARVWDKYEQTERRSIPSATVFLSPREQRLAQAMLNAAGIRTGYVFDGGCGEAERKILVFLPAWMEEPAGDELVFLRAAFHGEESLTHRDILGSLMGLGVTRERVGDILVSPHSADIVAAPSLRDFFLREWTQAGRVKLTVTEIGREELRLPQAQVKVIRDTVPSLRLDAVAAAAFSMSRGRAAELIAAGKVNLDHVPCLKGDKPVAEGAVLTARGFGKAKLTQVGGLSKKGRVGITVERYL